MGGRRGALATTTHLVPSFGHRGNSMRTPRVSDGLSRVSFLFSRSLFCSLSLSPSTASSLAHFWDDKAHYWMLREQRPVTNHPLMVGA